MQEPTSLPKDSWEALKIRFEQYRLRPSPTGMSPAPFTLGGRRLRRAYLPRYEKNARSAVNRVSRAIDALRAENLLPARPSMVSQRHINHIVQKVQARLLRPRPALRVFWEALISDRAGYRCRYCGRRSADVFSETKGVRALRLVVDHREPLPRKRRQRLMKESRDLKLKNCECACWSCNTVKANWPVKAFEAELCSLARAVLAPR